MKQQIRTIALMAIAILAFTSIHAPPANATTVPKQDAAGEYARGWVTQYNGELQEESAGQNVAHVVTDAQPQHAIAKYQLEPLIQKPYPASAFDKHALATVTRDDVPNLCRQTGGEDVITGDTDTALSRKEVMPLRAACLA